MESEILAALARSNLASATAILAVAAVRPLLRRFAGAGVAYAAWLVVPVAAMACLLPARSVVTVIARAPAVPPPPREGLTSLAAAAPPTGEAAFRIDWQAVLLCAWLAGAVIGVAWLLWRQHRFMAGIGPVRRDGQILRAQHSMAGPAVIGVLAPRILAPADFDRRFSAREQEVVLAHERNHIATGDPAINALVLLWQCLNWFNPLVHFAARALRLDQEFACDAAVMARFPRARRSYAEAMLKAQTAAMALPLGCYWPAAAASALEQRLVLLNAPRLPVGRRAAGAGGAVLLALMTSLAVWAAQPAHRIVRLAPEAGVSPLPASRPSRMEQVTPYPVPVKAAVAGEVASAPLTAADVAAASIANAPPASVQDDPGPPTTIDYAVRPDGWLPRLRPGVSIDMSISTVLPNGKLLGEHVTYRQGTAYTSGSVNFVPRYLLVPGARQVGDKVEFHPALYLDGQLIGSGAATVASGEAAELVLDNGQKVSVGAVLHAGSDGPPRPG
ncbi:M56 family metallopeptidase [Phenylobacterium sp.]|jgi:beta-lactamase regulating signal transducer with metallopeptidase domain|uniref:M56 family metallopeptidase n=1 Tax=Phenylobacterium sp. TaxID=1871053 RepID=UPI002F3F3A25